MVFSPCRSSDGRPSACLLGVMARLRSQLRARLPRAPPAPIRSPSAWRWVGGVLLGPLVLSKCPRLSLVALCEAEEAPLARSRPRVLEPRFNWTLFWQFLRPHLLVLGAAIVVRSSPAPPPNTREGKDTPPVCRSPPARATWGQLSCRAESQRPGAAGMRTRPRVPWRTCTGWLGYRVQGSPGAGGWVFLSERYRNPHSGGISERGRFRDRVEVVPL